MKKSNNREKDLRNEFDFVNSVFENIPGFIAYVDIETLCYKIVCKPLLATFNKTKDEVLGKYIRTIIGDDNFRIAKPFIDEVKQGKTVSFEQYFIIKNQKRCLSVSYAPHFDNTNKLIGFYIFSNDITLSKDVTQKLEEREHKFRSMFELSPDAACIVDRELGLVIDVNKSAEILYGYTREEMIGQSATVFSAEPEKTVEVIKNASQYIPLRYHKKKDGTIFPINLYSSLIEIQNREYLLFSIHDLSDFVRIQEKLEKQRDDLHRKELEKHDVQRKVIEQQLVHQIIQSLQQNTLIDEIIERLDQIKTDDTAPNSKILNIRNWLLSDKAVIDWETFKSHFDSIDTDFYDKIHYINNKLTSNDIRLCSFLRINLSTKEISLITKQSIRSIEVARYRLRVKLGLGKTVNLNSFFMKL